MVGTQSHGCFSFSLSLPLCLSLSLRWIKQPDEGKSLPRCCLLARLYMWKWTDEKNRRMYGWDEFLITLIFIGLTLERESFDDDKLAPPQQSVVPFSLFPLNKY